jgi:hypothetical protein
VVRGGCLGVGVFFTLSGFIVSYNYADRFRRFSRGAYRAFLWKWFARIYPVHLMTLAMMGALVLAADAMRMPLTSEARDTVETFTANRRGAGVARVPSVHMSSLVGGVRGGGMPRIPIASGVGGATASPPRAHLGCRGAGRRGVGSAVARHLRRVLDILIPGDVAANQLQNSARTAC